MPTAVTTPVLFPPLTPAALLAFQFSSWYPSFASLSIKSTVLPLTADFRAYLDADGVFVPDGAEDVPAVSGLSDDEDESEETDDSDTRHFEFPDLDRRIREVVKEYGAVFPKLNFSAPRDAAWMLPASSPLKCTSPADVYLLLKSSDFVLHDIDVEHLFDDCDLSDSTFTPPYELELVLRKWYPVDRSRELRCFVRQEILLGISQRDPNYYEFWNEPDIQCKVTDAVTRYWRNHIKGKWEHTDGNYTFDLLLTRDLERAHVVDFNPYASQTDPLLFTYDELLETLEHVLGGRNTGPELRVVDSPGHPAAIRNAPAHQHNMVPLEALAMSSGRGLEEFAELWKEEVRRGAQASDDEDEG